MTSHACSALKENQFSIFFFDCVIVKRTWELVSQAIGVHIVKDLESVAKLWICNKKCYIVNIVTSAVCWSL
jgi:hypothetical protein